MSGARRETLGVFVFAACGLRDIHQMGLVTCVCPHWIPNTSARMLPFSLSFRGDTSSCAFSTRAAEANARGCSRTCCVDALLPTAAPHPSALLSPPSPALSPLRACLTFHNCIITRSVSSRRKWSGSCIAKNFATPLGAGALHPPTPHRPI